jgi:hypothetical protein
MIKVCQVCSDGPCFVGPDVSPTSRCKLLPEQTKFIVLCVRFGCKKEAFIRVPLQNTFEFVCQDCFNAMTKDYVCLQHRILKGSMIEVTCREIVAGLSIPSCPICIRKLL